MPYYLVMKKTSPMGENLLRELLLKVPRVLSKTQAWSTIQTGLFSVLLFKHTDSGALSHGVQSTIPHTLVHGTQRASLSKSRQSLISGKQACLPAINGVGHGFLSTRPKHRIWYAAPFITNKATNNPGISRGHNDSATLQYRSPSPILGVVSSDKQHIMPGLICCSILTSSPEYHQRPLVFNQIACDLFNNVLRLYEQIDAQFLGRSSDESVGAQMAAFCVYTCGLFSIYLWRYPNCKLS